LLLLIDPFIYRLYQCRVADRRHVFILISSPLVDLASVLLLASIFNWRIAIAYVVVGLILAVIGGSLISHLKLEKYVESYVFKIQVVQAWICRIRLSKIACFMPVTGPWRSSTRFGSTS
jgi:uncharacterized membrane protein YraQ (UPF0718 family)